MSSDLADTAHSAQNDDKHATTGQNQTGKSGCFAQAHCIDGGWPSVGNACLYEIIRSRACVYAGRLNPA